MKPQILIDAEQVIAKCILVPNDLLPEHYRDNRTDAVTLESINKKLAIRAREIEAEREVYEKERRIEAYRAMIDKGEEIQYIPKKGWVA